MSDLDDVDEAVAVDVDRRGGGLRDDVGDTVTVDIDDLRLDGHVDFSGVVGFRHCRSQARPTPERNPNQSAIAP